MRSPVGKRDTEESSENAAWGKHAWFLLHHVSFCYPSVPCTKTRRNMYRFVKSTSDVIPCHACRSHMRGYMDRTGFHSPSTDHLRSSEAFSRWMYALHDDVNTRLGKSSPPFDEIKNLYTPLCCTSSRCSLESDLANAGRSEAHDRIVRYPGNGAATFATLCIGAILILLLARRRAPSTN